ncbi:MAG: polyprenyl synthetase family protein [Bacteroides sp.]|nr:polyprenyl synthetase family protein [Prevotella sp.]MCM1408434.1 polyprenyl synthetase family protein [Treponema brennaborense]MCM1469404.1 polyprenyl synthetase family protein [Bacteroides sp.]
MEEYYTQRLKKIEAVLRRGLPENSDADWEKDTFGEIPGCITDTHVQNLLAPCRNLLLLGGKRWRPLFLVLCAELAAKTEDVGDAYAITPLVEYIHTASLIHDDIEDNADTRRGNPAAHITYGTDAAINAGSWLYFKALTIIRTLPAADTLKNKLYALSAQEISRLHLGQAMDISWHKNERILPSIQEYNAMVRLKTGTLSSLAARAGILAGGGSDRESAQMGAVAANIGVSFQIIDDAINLTTGNAGKKRGDDIVEGKKSLPLLLHLQNRPQDIAAITECFEKARNEGIESPAVEKCIEIIAGDGAVEQARRHAEQLLDRSCAEIEKLYGEDAHAVPLIAGLFRGMARS